MPRRPELESVVAWVASLAAIGMTVAAILMPDAEPALPTSVQAVVPAVATVAAQAPALRPLGAVDGSGLPRQAPPAVVPASASAPPVGARGTPMCALSALRHHVGHRASGRRAEPVCSRSLPRPDPEAGVEPVPVAPPPASAGAAPCAETLRNDAEGAAPRCLARR
jgi:hypothetical protein